MKIAIIGTGYVGLVTGACLAETGNNVICFDIDSEKIAGLKNAHVPIYEPGLTQYIERNVENQRLSFTDDFSEVINQVEVLFVAVGTPPDEDGSADIEQVLSAAKQIADRIESYCLIVTKSTVPVGTSHRIKQVISDRLKVRELKCDFDVASNPEFLKEGAAIQDFMNPDRIIVGAETEKATDLLKQLYMPFNRTHGVIQCMDILSSELTKYASNCMLATKISFMNEVANIADCVGANIEKVKQAMGADPRIGYHFINPGAGYGGSCFPKDVRALSQMAKGYGYKSELLNAVESVNEKQKRILFTKIKNHFGDVRGLCICIWGLTFKPKTDDIREASSQVLISQLLESGASVRLYDPKGIKQFKQLYDEHSSIEFCSTAMQAVNQSDALVLVTEWEEFWSVDFHELKSQMKQAVLFDGRNIWNPTRTKAAGFVYYGIGIS